MIPHVRDFVVLIFKNSIKVEGIVNYWSEKKIVLESRTGDCVIVVNDFADVLAYKIIKEVRQNESVPDETIKSEPPRQALPSDYVEQQQFVKETNIPRHDDGSVNIQSLVELRKMEAEAERQVIINKLKNHRASGVQPVKYDNPRFFKK